MAYDTVATIPQRKRWRIEPRYKIVACCFLATFAMYAERVGFSIAFTAMAKEAQLDESIKGTVMSAFYWGYALSQVCHWQPPPASYFCIRWSCYALMLRTCPMTPIRHAHRQAMWLTCLQVPGGWAAQLYGGRVTLIISFFLWSLVSMFTPTNAKNTHTIMAARVLIGIAQGFIIPSVHTVLSQVRSDFERGRACMA